MAKPRSFSKPKRDFNDPVSPPAHSPAFIPAPPTNNVNLNLPLDIILPGADAKIAQAQTMVFHAVGDTGGVKGTETQEGVAAVMVQQIEDSRANNQPAEEPLFFYHLGDVVYFNGMSPDYPVQFYEPYQNYDAPIVAIAGNHDGDTRTRTGDTPDDETTLYGFMQNFCSPTAQFLFKHRSTMTQPYVYWTLDTPLATIIGLYSNVDGELDAKGTFEQQHWLAQQLQAAPTDRALIVAVHHAPYSLDTSHGGYGDIGTALDRAINTTGRTPDLVLSGHVHNYQRSFPFTFSPVPQANDQLVGPKGEVNGEWKFDKTFADGATAKPKGVIYIVSGAGGADLYNTEQQADPTTWQPFTYKYVADEHSLSVIDVQGSVFRLKQISESGKQVDSFQISK